MELLEEIKKELEETGGLADYEKHKRLSKGE